MSHPDCYTHYVRDWQTNDGGTLIGDPRLAWKIIPELECEEIRVGSFPRSVADVSPDMFLDPAAIVALWEEKHIDVARMHLFGVTKTLVRKSKKKWDEEMKRAGSVRLGSEELYSWRSFLRSESGIYTRDTLERRIREMQKDPSPNSYLLGGKPIRVIGCVIYIHAQTEGT